MKQYWTNEEDQIIIDNYSKLGAKQTARLLNRTYYALRNHATRCLGLRRNVRATVDDNYFLNWTPNMSYALGYIYADGHVAKSGSHLALRCHSKDDEIIVKILEDMKYAGTLYHIDARIIGGRNNGPQTYANVASNFMVHSLYDHGLVHNKTYQDIPFPFVPDEYLPHFIRGYFDGDGCISIKDGRYYCINIVATKTFAEQLQDKVCTTLNVTKRKLLQQTTIYSVVWSKLKDVQKISHWLYPEGQYIYLERKRNKMESSYDIVKKPNPLALSLSAFGQTWTLRQLALSQGLDETSLGDYIKDGMTPEEAVSIAKTAQAKQRGIKHFGKTASEWSNILGVSKTLIWKSIRENRLEELINKKSLTKNSEA